MQPKRAFSEIASVFSVFITYPGFRSIKSDQCCSSTIGMDTKCVVKTHMPIFFVQFSMACGPLSPSLVKKWAKKMWISTFGILACRDILLYSKMTADMRGAKES
jgi:hypothetical protein